MLRAPHLTGVEAGYRTKQILFAAIARHRARRVCLLARQRLGKSTALNTIQRLRQAESRLDHIRRPRNPGCDRTRSSAAHLHRSARR